MKAKLITADGAYKFENIQRFTPSIDYALLPSFSGAIQNLSTVEMEVFETRTRRYIFMGERDKDGAYIYREEVR